MLHITIGLYHQIDTNTFQVLLLFQVKTSTKEYFQLEFHSPCLDGVMRSKNNHAFNAYKPGYCNPRWTSEQLVKVS